MSYAFIFIAKYFWLFASITLVLVGDILFIIRSIEDIRETISIYKREKKDKSYLKGKFTSSIICVICNIVIVLVVMSLLYYVKDIIAMREIIANM